MLGPHGAGKTTTVECIAGLRTPDGGSVRVLGLETARDPRAVRQRVGVQLQLATLPSWTRRLGLWWDRHVRPVHRVSRRSMEEGWSVVPVQTAAGAGQAEERGGQRRSAWSAG